MKIKFNNSINNLSQIIGLDLHYFISGGFWSILPILISIISGFVLSALYARVWPADVFGRFTFMTSLLSFMALTALPGMNLAISQAAAENRHGVFKKIISIVAKYSLLGTLILIGLSVYFIIRQNTNLGIALILSALAFPLSSISSLYTPFLNGQKQFRLNSVYNCLAQLFYLIITSLALIIQPNLIIVAIAANWSLALINSLFLFIEYGKLKNNEQDDSLISLGFHLSFSQIFSIAADYSDRLIIPIMLGFTNNAIYAFAILIPLQIHNLFKIFTSLAQPKINDLSKKNFKAGIFQKSILFEIFIALIVIIYILLSPKIFDILYPAYKQSSLFLSQIFSLSLLYFPTNLLGLSFVKTRDTKSLYIINMSYVFITVFSLIIFGLKWGLIGVVVSKVISRSVQAIIQIYLFQKTKL